MLEAALIKQIAIEVCTYIRVTSVINCVIFNAQKII